MFLSRVACATDRTENVWLSPFWVPSCVLGPSCSKGYYAIYRKMQFISLIFIHWIVIYLVDSAIQLLNNWGQDLITVKREISPGAYIFQRPFLRGLYTGENLHLKIDWANFFIGRKFKSVICKKILLKFTVRM